MFNVLDNVFEVTPTSALACSREIRFQQTQARCAFRGRRLPRSGGRE